MVGILPYNPSTTDLAGQIYLNPNYFQSQRRIKSLVDCYLCFEKLNNRLQDLPIQFENPRSRPWKLIDWQTIHRDQIIGIDLDVFLSIIAGAIDTEAPIRGYTQTSRQYLEKLHPKLARFVGGTVGEDGVLELGLWEKEERQHTPTLLKIYQQLTDKKIAPTPHNVREYEPSDNRYADLYRHGLHRIATEYGATCLYLWLMAHTTGQLQTVLEELALDEINHLTKFWGFGVWAFPESSRMAIAHTLIETIIRPTYNRNRSSLIGTLHRMTKVLNWQTWSLTNKATFIYTCTYTLHHLCSWNKSLTPEYLQQLFGEPLNHPPSP